MNFNELGFLNDIEGASHAAVDKYFSNLNSSNYSQVAELFADQGCLYPPFEKAVCGKAAITQYLEAEARGVIADPEFATLTAEDSGNLCYQVKGKVKTSFFTVNVSWLIQLNPAQEILSVKVKLLNELSDLLALKSKDRAAVNYSLAADSRLCPVD